MSEQLLTILKLCLLALLYLFFLRVLRAVWTEVSPPRVPAPGPASATGRVSAKRSARPVKPAKAAKPTKSRRRVPAAPSRLVVVEPPERAGIEYPLGSEVTIGRASGCNIVLDEQYVSQVHTRLFTREGSIFAEDLGSTNGTWVNGARAVGQMPARLGDRIQIGNVVLEVR
ncbi:MAG: FHA domain-containing protein [Microthrixaceae bacterium]